MDYVQLEKDVKRAFSNIDHCNEQVDIANDKLNLVRVDIKDVLVLLKGNPHNSTDLGVLGRLTSSEKRIEKLEKFKDRVIWVIVGMALTSGYGISEIVRRVSEYIKH